MAVLSTLNGAATGLGFLVSGGPAGELRLRTDDGSTQAVTLRGAGPLAGAITLTPAAATVSGVETIVQIKASAPSAAQADAVVEVVAGAGVVASHAFTAIVKPTIQFEGRYQCRLATDPDNYDDPWGSMSSFGMYAVQGPNAAAPYEPPLDRIVRFQGAVALRSLCPVIGVSVKRVRGELAGGAAVAFQDGDTLLGQPVKLGPACVLDARDGTFADPGFEPISNFQIAVGTAFSGESVATLPRAPGTPPPNTAPYADGLFRMDSVSALRPPDFGYPDATWTARAAVLTARKLVDLNAQVPATPAETEIRARRIAQHTLHGGGISFALRLVERYDGIVDQNLAVTPGTSQVIKSFAGAAAFRFHCEFFDFDTDCQCGTCWGTISPV